VAPPPLHRPGWGSAQPPIYETAAQPRVFYAFLDGFNDMFNYSGPLPIPVNITLNVTYIHKYMDLDQIHVGYFLNQVVPSAEYFRFSQGDSVYMSTVFNRQYNVRCAAPVGTQLYSVCQNPT
jgi:hypothetical protein